MEFTIKELSFNLTNDYLDFFDNLAFSDDNPNGPCYCTSPFMDKITEEKMVSEFGNDIKGTIRRYAVEMLKEGKIRGYLAFEGDIAIGWCNAADMESYLAFIPDIARQNKCGKTFSVVCFSIAPEYRGKGIATSFLNRVCSDAKSRGYSAVEGYVKLNNGLTNYDYNGPTGLYEKAGFSKVARQDKQIIMRKLL
jgi:ribosomal protein S18 acetylase RimI-like enzyme